MRHEWMCWLWAAACMNLDDILKEKRKNQGGLVKGLVE